MLSAVIIGQSPVTQLVECRVLTNHYCQLTNMLFQTNLIPHLVKEEIILPSDEEELSSISTSTKKAQFVLQKISAALQSGFSQSYYKLLNIMKSYGNCDLKQLAAMMESEEAKSSATSNAGLYNAYISYYIHVLHITDIEHQRYIYAYTLLYMYNSC